MKYSETGFRPLYHNFCYFPMVENIKKCVKEYPGYDGADGVLAYGYIDRECGMTLEILACAKRTGEDEFAYASSLDTVRVIIRIGAVKDVEYTFVAEGEDGICENFTQKLEIVRQYDAEEEVEESRLFGFLDEFRHELYPDDVLVLTLKDGLQPEGCWVRIIGLEEKCIMGKLLNEPNQNFGYHEGDTIAFFLYEDNKGNKHLVSDMNPSIKLTEEDLEDGSILERAITVFNSERTKDHLIDVMVILRDSYVWIPCNAIMSENDQARILEMIEFVEGGSLIGSTFSNNDDVRMVPDVLQKGDKYFFPIFSTAEAMGEYGNNFSKVQKHFIEALHMARANDKELEGIVINAFSEPMIIDAELFDIIENMKSSL